jgi:two-component system CheB/CheR fusion protein
VLEDDDREVEDYETCELFLAAFQPGRSACLVIDAYLPGMNGLTLLRRLREAGHALPAIMITGNSDVAIAVEAMKVGASDFIEKPISRAELLGSVNHALERSRDSGKLSAWRNDAASHVARLTPRQRPTWASASALWRTIARLSWRRRIRNRCQPWRAWRWRRWLPMRMGSSAD